ncbi:TPA: hypothetical protein ACVO3I_001150 [Vibrio diabolicus]
MRKKLKELLTNITNSTKKERLATLYFVVVKIQKATEAYAVSDFNGMLVEIVLILLILWRLLAPKHKNQNK